MCFEEERTVNGKRYPVNSKQYTVNSERSTVHRSLNTVYRGAGNFVLFGLFAGLFFLIARANLTDTTRRGLEVTVVLVFGSLFYLFDEAEYMIGLQKMHTHEQEPASSLPTEPDAGSLFDLYYRIDLPTESTPHDSDMLSAPGTRQEN
jgi:hypothetical protein